MNLRGQPSLRHDFQPFARLGVCLFIVGPLELRERRARNSAGLEPPVAVCLTPGAVGPSALLGDVERTRGIDGRFAAMGLADADELDKSPIHYDAVTERVARIELAIEPWEGSLLPLQHTRAGIILGSHDVSILLQPNCFAVRRQWQFEHRTSHLSISASSVSRLPRTRK